MFGKKDKKSIEVTKLSSLIADNLHISGDVLFTGGLRVDGRIEGNVLGKAGEKSLIVLSDKGCVVGKIHAYDAVVNGTVSGDLDVEHFLELQAGARVSGNITYRQLQMECGATVEGKLVRVAEPGKDVPRGANVEQKPRPDADAAPVATAASMPSSVSPQQPLPQRQGIPPQVVTQRPPATAAAQPAAPRVAPGLAPSATSPDREVPKPPSAVSR